MKYCPLTVIKLRLLFRLCLRATACRPTWSWGSGRGHTRAGPCAKRPPFRVAPGGRRGPCPCLVALISIQRPAQLGPGRWWIRKSHRRDRKRPAQVHLTAGARGWVETWGASRQSLHPNTPLARLWAQPHTGSQLVHCHALRTEPAHIQLTYVNDQPRPHG